MNKLETLIKTLQRKSSSVYDYEVLERRIKFLDVIGLSNGINRLEALNLNLKSDWWNNLRVGERIDNLERKSQEFNPEGEPTAVRFRDLCAKNLTEMIDFLEANVLSLHFRMVVDFYLVIKYIS